MDKEPRTYVYSHGSTRLSCSAETIVTPYGVGDDALLRYNLETGWPDGFGPFLWACPGESPKFFVPRHTRWALAHPVEGTREFLITVVYPDQESTQHALTIGLEAHAEIVRVSSGVLDALGLALT